MSDALIDRREPPGDPLEQGQDAGGVRWFLAGRPVHAGYGVELLMEGPAQRCGCKEGCERCDGSEWLHTVRWTRCRFEYTNTREPVAWLYPPVHGTWDARIEVVPRMRCRWPEKRRRFGD